MVTGCQHEAKAGSVATCSKQVICAVCGEGFGQLDPTNHTWEDGICTICGTACAHTGGTATCLNRAVCKICGASYGELGDHVFLPEREGLCGACGEECPHTGGSATCTEQAVCEVCKMSYGKLSDHNIDSDGVCTACGTDTASSVTDGINTFYAIGASGLNQAVTSMLETGSRTFTVNLSANADVAMITAIRRAICDADGVADGSIHLTIKGVTSIPADTNLDMEIFNQLASIDLPDVLTIGEYAFNSCEGLTSVTAPKVQTIGEYAFYCCVRLTSVTAPEVRTIGKNAFTFTALTAVEFPELTTIPYGMFAATDTLTSAKFPKVTTIENGGLLIGAGFNHEAFLLELTAAGDITFNGANHFNISSQNYSDKVDLVLCCDKADEVDGLTWKGYTFKSITFTEHSFDGNACTICGVVCEHTGGTATCTQKPVCDLCGASYGYEDRYNHTGGTTVRFNWPEDISDSWDVELVCGDCNNWVEYTYVYAEDLRSEIKTLGDCQNPDVVTYTATVTFNDQEYTEQKDYEIPSANHANMDANGFCTCGGYEAAVYNEDAWVYEISNAGQLYWFANRINNVSNEAYAILTADIVIPDDAPQWEPMMNFYGSFDGNFKTISGLKVVSDGDYVGMFGGGAYAYGSIMNLHIANATVIGDRYVGALAGYHAASIENCYVTNSTVQGNGFVGTMVGQMGGEVRNCYTDSSSLVGNYHSGYVTVENSYYVSAEETDDGGKTETQFASGEVAYLLQAGVKGDHIGWDENDDPIYGEAPHIWGQTIDSQSFPAFGGQKVYQVANCKGEICAYSNSDDTNVHIYDNVCDAECSACGEAREAPHQDSNGDLLNALSVSSSVRDHAVRVLESDASDAVKTLYMDMLNYGAAAQAHFGYDAATPVNAGLDAYQIYATQEIALNDQREKGTAYSATTLEMESELQLNLLFSKNTVKKTMYAVITIVDENGKVMDEYQIEGSNFKSHTNNRWRIEIEGLNPENYDYLIKCEIYRGNTLKASATDSIGSYLTRAINGNGGAVYEMAMRFYQRAKAVSAE